MGNAGKITKELAAWAHEIRQLGNDAAHEDDPFDEKSARDLYAFTELFLMYVFTLPGMMDERKKAVANGGGNNKP